MSGDKCSACGNVWGTCNHIVMAPKEKPTLEAALEVVKASGMVAVKKEPPRDVFIRAAKILCQAYAPEASCEGCKIIEDSPTCEGVWHAWMPRESEYKAMLSAQGEE